MVARRQKPIYAFIDSQNLNLGVRSQGWKLDVSGDGDFHCLIEYLDSKRKLSKILVPNSKYSSLLRKFARYITQIQLFRQKIQLTRSTKTQKKGIR